MIQRLYQLTVATKQEFGSLSRYNIVFSYELNNPIWLSTSLDGSPLHLNVTKEEFDSIKIGDIFTIQITSR